MSKSNTYYPPIHPKRTSTRQDEKWDEAVGLFNNKQFEKVIPTLLDYIDPNLKNKKKGETYDIPHGSVVISITQTADELWVKCPLLNIANAKKVPLMRRLAELRMSPLNLTNLVLEGDLVFFAFSCPITLCEPNKVYGVLREVCYYADSFDDEFIEKFDAEHLQEPKIRSFSEAIKQEAYANCQKIIADGLERFERYLEKRHGNNAWYALTITLKNLEFYIEPQGYLRTQLEKALDALYDGRIPFHDRLMNGKSDLEKLKQLPEEKFLSDLYQIETFIPYKYSGKKENIRENWQESYEEVQEMISNSRFEDAVNLLQSCFYSLFYYNLVNEEISKPITDALSQASGLEYHQAAPILLKGMQAIMEDSFAGMDFGMDLSKLMGEQMQQSMAMMQQLMANYKTN
ncbi:hypothetical protein DZC72_02920 [Maribacter algicola]|uniref:YbjN domain-containing protein n=1 Tax=Maribacter algicola TaxID=2498892 RepID=A0A426RKT0_9FLAO|nr:hypothetical protein [Maribacter algicola]RRQ49570.1 hypothetical protein DZC72_02920 [Maribacter algicola]